MQTIATSIPFPVFNPLYPQGSSASVTEAEQTVSFDDVGHLLDANFKAILTQPVSGMSFVLERPDMSLKRHAIKIGRINCQSPLAK